MFKTLDGRESFYQWDSNIKLIVEDSSITQVHFCNRTDSCSLVCETYQEEGLTLVNVPNILLQTAWRIHCYAFGNDKTKYEKCFEVKARTKPSDYVYTETEVLNYNSLLEQIEEVNNNIPNVVEEYLKENPIDLSEYITEEEVISLINNDKWEIIDKICFGYELLTEKPDDWDENKTTKYYYAVTEGHSKMALCVSWFNWEPNKYWKYTGEYDTQIQKIQRNQEPDGTPYNFKAVSVFGHIFNTSAQGLWCFSAYLYSNYAESNSISGVATLPVGNATYPHHFNYRVTQQAGVYDLICYSGGQGDKTAVTGVSNAASGMMMKPTTSGNIKALSAHIWSAKEYYSEGDYIEIWGVRADG